MGEEYHHEILMSLKTKLSEKNAKAKLLEIGYKVGGGIGSRERNDFNVSIK